MGDDEAGVADVERNSYSGEEDELPELPKKVQLPSMPIYVLQRRLGKGGFGQVWLGQRLIHRKCTSANKPYQVAIKFEACTSKGLSRNGTPHEWAVYAKLGALYGVPRIFARGRLGDYFTMAMELLGPSLWDEWNARGAGGMPVPFVACVAVEALRILQGLHQKGYVHGDVKPENLLLGAPGSEGAKRLFLVDVGLAVLWRTPEGHAKYQQVPNEFRGTIRYASVHAHLGRTASRRDDLESLAYTLLFLLLGRLPWQGLQGEDKGFQVCKHKMEAGAEALCSGDWPDAFVRFIGSVLALKFDEEPRYEAYRALFEPITLDAASAERPIQLLCPPRAPAAPAKALAGHKRARSDSAEDTRLELELGDGEPDLALSDGRKRARRGWPATQWITVYNKRKPQKQRYHYNVNAERLGTHVAKGYREGLFITCVCSHASLWAVIMDAGTRFTAQEYKVSSRQFMPKEWITQRWDEGYYITSVAGSDNGSCLVVMSQGTRWNQQSYKVDNAFPYEWIRKKWREGFHVTSLATAGKPPGQQQWAVVMSRDCGYKDQMVEIDFMYPSEGIHCHWDKGYRITACGATHDQAAFVLSLPKRESGDATQETLRTSEFPAAQIKEKWANDLYIEHFAYGRTVS